MYLVMGGEQVRSLREEKENIATAQFAEASGVSSKTLAEVEKR